MKRALAVSLLLVVAFAAAGCGKSRSSTASGAKTTTTAVAAAGGSTTTVKGATTTTVKGATTTTVKGATTTTVKGVGPSTTSTTVPVTTSVDHACVHPGDRQGFTLDGPRRSYVIWDTVYSNQTDELTTHYGTGSGKDLTDDKGHFHTLWVMALNVPPGDTLLRIAVLNGRVITQKEEHFTIKALGQPC